MNISPNRNILSINSLIKTICGNWRNPLQVCNFIRLQTHWARNDLHRWTKYESKALKFLQTFQGPINWGDFAVEGPCCGRPTVKHVDKMMEVVESDHNASTAWNRDCGRRSEPAQTFYMSRLTTTKVLYAFGVVGQKFYNVLLPYGQTLNSSLWFKQSPKFELQEENYVSSGQLQTTQINCDSPEALSGQVITIFSYLWRITWLVRNWTQEKTVEKVNSPIFRNKDKGCYERGVMT